MTDRMPDFAMPSDEELGAERRAEAIARARAADPTSAVRERLGLEQEPIDEDALDGAESRADAAPGPSFASPVDPPVPDPADRIHSRRASRPPRAPSAVRRRVMRIVRNPIVAFATGAVVVGAGFLAAPALTAWTERGSQAQLEQLVEAYAAAVSTGDVEVALDLHRPDERYGSLAVLDAGVAPSTLPSMSCEPPTSTNHADVAIARCTLTLSGFGGSGSPLQLRLERSGGDWTLGSGVEQRARLVPDLFELVAIEDVAMEGVLEADVPDYWMLPGAYEAETRTTPLIELTDYGGYGLVVTEGGGYLDAIPQASELVIEEVEAAALAWAQSCVVDVEMAASCGLAMPRPGSDVTASHAQAGSSQDRGVLGIPVRISGLDAVVQPNVEVLVRFDDTWTSFELEVTGVTDMYR